MIDRKKKKRKKIQEFKICAIPKLCGNGTIEIIQNLKKKKKKKIRCNKGNKSIFELVG